MLGKKTRFIAICLLIFVALLCVACGTPPAGPQDAGAGTAGSDMAANGGADDEPMPLQVSATECFVEGQVFLTGPPALVRANARSGWVELEEFPFEYFNRLLDPEQIRLPVPPPNDYYYTEPISSDQLPQIVPIFSDKDVPPVTILYRIDENENVSTVVKEINESRMSGGDFVFADFNYLLGSLPPPPKIGTLPSGTGITTEGSDWPTRGSPFGGTIYADPNDPTARNDFDAQWAFDGDHINLPAAGDWSVKGGGVLVGVFDAFPDEEGSAFNPPWVTVIPVDDPDDSDDDPVDISDHGTLVVDLLKGVAEEITVEEFRVLNKYGRGTLDVLLRELDHFVRDRVIPNREELNGAVINLSLGFPWCASYLESPEVEEVVSLWTKLVAANQSNIVVVAAAGNESSAGLAMPAEIPARWPNVIGVKASDKDGTRACFSNEGDVFAPGGAGTDDGLCQPATDQCSNEGSECRYGLISKNSEDKYVYVTGTSYAAPLVSGLAALSYEAGPNNAMGPNMTRLGASNDIKNAIYCGTSDGVINVERTLQSLGQSSICRGEGLIFGGKWFDDARVQKAVLHAVDWETIAITLNLPSLYSSGHVLDLHFPGYLLSLGDGQQYYKLFDDFSMLSIAHEPYDLDRAEALLKAAWCPDEEIDPCKDDDGFWKNPDGERAVFEFYGLTGHPSEMVRLMAHFVEQLGLETTVTVYEKSSILQDRLDQIGEESDLGPVLILWPW